MSQQYVLEGDQRRLVLPEDATQHSSARTEHYGLNFWAPTDKFVRSDFNADNLKIDAALDQALRIVKLKEIVTAETTSSIDLDFTNLDLSEYIELHIYIKLLTTANASGEMLINGCTEEVYTSGGGSYYPFLLAVGPSYDGTENFAHFKISCLNSRLKVQTDSGSAYYATKEGLKNLSDLAYLRIQRWRTGTINFLPGSTILMYGFRR